ncbi:MAG: DUF2948 family protein [Sphingomonadaceae bacterium]
MTELLHLLATDSSELATVSALVQDMTVKAGEAGWRPRQRRLVLLGNRFRWEAPDPPTRVRTALRFEHVLKVERREWPDEPHAVLPLLAIAPEPADGPDAPPRLLLSFGGGAALRLTVEAIDLLLEDIAGPWGAQAVPDHRLDEADSSSD